MNASEVKSTLSKYILADGIDIVWDLDRSHGSQIFDAKSQKSFLDLFSFFASQPIAFNHPKLATKEFKEKLGHFAIHRPSLSDVYTVEFAEAVDTFGRLAIRGHFDHLFFVEGGTLGVENALKVAFDWKVRKNIANGVGENGSKVIHFQKAFHGRSGYTLSLTNTADPRKHMYFPKFDWPRISSPALTFPINEASLAQVTQLEERAIHEIESALQNNPNDIAALIIEPIQAEGGDRHFRTEFLQTLRKLADDHEFLLIFDEVQTGFGLTGTMWAFEQLGVKPDLISFGKKAQVAGCASTSRVDEVEKNVFHESSRINSTWGGNLVDFMRVQKYLEIIEEDGLVQNASLIGEHIVSELRDIAESTGKISNVRGRGLMIAFDLPSTDTRNQVKQTMFNNGAMILPCGEKSLRLRPHLDFTKEDAAQALSIIKASI
ncbi:MAG: L-lysine 6-transaminase [Bdellovibrionales bacterium]|nr:L-lysine 6-transaminase [Bdellovibrionales bacterium]